MKNFGINPNGIFTALIASISLTDGLIATSDASILFSEPIVLESPNAQTDGYFGAGGVGWVPDVNGDDIVDIVTSAYNESPSGSPVAAGRVYVFDGATRELLHEFKSPNETANSSFGIKCAGIADLNGNGSGEVISATHNAENRTYVIDGATGETIHIFPTRARSISPVPDVNGDGMPEIVVGFDGEALLYDGSSGVLERSVRPPRGGASNLYGWSVSGVEDVNGDGLGDVIVGDMGFSDWMGRAHVFDGATGRQLHILLSPRAASRAFGRSVAGLPDINGDERGDLIVTSSEGGGPEYLFDGDTGQPLISTEEGAYGWTASALPDVTGDGLSDVVMSRYVSQGVEEACVFDSSSGLKVATLAGNLDFGGGGSIAGVPDINGDGLGEVLVANYSARASSNSRAANAGHALLYLSAPQSVAPHLQAVGLNGASFTLIIDSTSGDSVRVEASDDLLTWTQIVEVTPDGDPLHIEDTETADHPKRFYRAVRSE